MTRRVSLPRLHAGQAHVVAHSKRFNVVACGRRFGKSILGSERLMYHALTTNEHVAYFTPTYRMGADMYEQLAMRLNPVVRSRHKGEHLLLKNGARIDLWAITPTIADRVRGRKYGLVVIDEAAMIDGLKKTYETVIRPTLADWRGGAWFLSTPKGRNDFYEFYQRGVDDTTAYSTWFAYTAPTSDNPYITADEIDAMRHELSELVYYQEVLAQFLSLEGAVFRNINAAVQPVDTAYNPNHTYVAGFDIARVEGGDYSVITIFDATDQTVVYIDRFSGVSFELQVARMVALAERYNLQTTLIDATGIGMPMFERLQKHIRCQGVTFTQQIKTHLIERLAWAFERNQLVIPHHVATQPLINELLSFVAERAQMGTVKYGAPKGQHDDCVISLALAYQAGYTNTGSGQLVY